MIDFGISLPYQYNGKHVEEEKTIDFKGNIQVASYEKMTFKHPTRKEDLFSLGNLMLSMLGASVFHTIYNDMRMSFDEKYDRIRDMKEGMTAKDYCTRKGGEKVLEYMEEVFKIKYSETPNYQKLKCCLIKQLLDLGYYP